VLYSDKNDKVIPVAWFQEEFGKLRERQEAIREELSHLDEEIEDFMEKGMIAMNLVMTLRISILAQIWKIRTIF
jgi:hypothetical protein